MIEVKAAEEQAKVEIGDYITITTREYRALLRSDVQLEALTHFIEAKDAQANDHSALFYSGELMPFLCE